MRKFIPYLFLIAACSLFFYQTFTRGLLPVPTDTLIGLYHPWFDLKAATNPRGVPYKNFLITDPVRQQIPWRKLVVDALKKGTVPAWNPYTFAGTSLIGNIQAGVFYPLNVLFLLFPFPDAWTILIILQPVLASLFMFIYLQNKKIGISAALIAALAWAYCGYSVAWLTWGTIVQTALWLPLILMAIDKLHDADNHVLWSGVLVLALSASFFAGHAQIALYVFLLTGIYACFRFSRWVIPAGILTILITGTQWVPMIRTFGGSSRIYDASVWQKAGWFLPWQHLVQFLAPDFFGNPATGNYWGIWNYGEFIGYVGILPLIFAVWAIIVRKDRLTRFFAICAGIVFLFLLPTPLAKIPYQLHIPLWSTMQPTRLMVIADFCLLIVSGLGIDHFIRHPSKKILYVVLCMAILTGSMMFVPNEVARHNLILPAALVAGSGLLLLLYSKKIQTVWVGAVLLFVCFDLFRFGWKFTPFTPREYFFPETRIISFLTSQTKPFRVAGLDNRILPPNVSAYYGIETPEGYDPVYNARYEQFIAALNRNKPDISPPFGFNRIITLSSIDSPLVSLLNVRYILSLSELHRPDLELVFEEGETKVYRFKNALPRIFPVESVETVTGDQETVNRLYSRNFNPKIQALVRRDISIPPSPLTAQDHVDIRSETPDSVTVFSELAADHFVVVLTGYHPGWSVTIDGKAATLYETDYTFQGFVAPKGSHRIVLEFKG